MLWDTIKKFWQKAYTNSPDQKVVNTGFEKINRQSLKRFKRTENKNKNSKRDKEGIIKASDKKNEKRTRYIFQLERQKYQSRK